MQGKRKKKVYLSEIILYLRKILYIEISKRDIESRSRYILRMSYNKK